MINMIKLCVGISSVQDLQFHRDQQFEAAMRQGAEYLTVHRTRMTPKRADEILDGGSLYWVIAGKVQVRQQILELREVFNSQGTRYCDIVMDPALILTAPQPRRPFQGWRYLTAGDAPADMSQSAINADLDPAMAAELAELGLL